MPYTIVEEGLDVETDLDTIDDAIVAATDYLHTLAAAGDFHNDNDTAEVYVNNQETDKTVTTVRISLIVAVDKFATE